MNKCCKEEFQRFQDKLAQQSKILLDFSGNQVTAMEQAAARRAEFIIDVMAELKNFVASR